MMYFDRLGFTLPFYSSSFRDNLVGKALGQGHYQIRVHKEIAKCRPNFGNALDPGLYRT
jgi:hypothetical protein